MDDIPQEKGFRDIALSRWRKKLGWDLAANDLDLIVVEYNKNKPKALIEFKLEHSTYRDESTEAVRQLAIMAGLPFFLVRYHEQMKWWQVRSMNQKATDMQVSSDQITERQFVEFLYRLRGVEPTADQLEGLSDQLPVRLSSEEMARRNAEHDQWIKDNFGG